MIRLAALVIALGMAAPASADSIVLALSETEVNVTADFDGSDITIFGVIERDAHTVARGGTRGIAIMVLGPREDVLVQRRVRRLGIWGTGQTRTFRNVPAYVALKYTDGLPRETAESLLGKSIRPTGGAPVSPEPFRDALIVGRMEAGLYDVQPGAVTMLTDKFFRTRIRLPGTISDGDYSVSATLFSNGLPLDSEATDFTVRKVGLEQQIFDLSQNRPLLYGLMAVAVALFTGYVGGVVFKRN